MNQSKIITRSFAFIAILILLAACSGKPATMLSYSPASSTQAPTSDTGSSAVSPEVTIKGFAFTPGTLTIKVGTTVKWTNQDSVAHTVTSDTGLFDSGDLAAGDTFSYTFTQAGTFAYHCTMHPSMTATIVVTE
jgi:plastocyanin